MKSNVVFGTFYRRFLVATLLWAVSWPALWFFKIGDITGPKAWFWIVGELSYPVVAIVYVVLDSLLQRSALKPWMIFTVSIVLIAGFMPFYYERYGFALGVSLEARFL